MENELFGHARGAFTGADRESKGLVALADGGTLFLDEIDALSLAAQAKLLRFLQERTFRPLGSDRLQHANVKVVAATNRDLAKSVRESRFRADLYFRLNILHVHLPPLRERQGDVVLLAQRMLEQANAKWDGPPKSFTRAALRALEAHDWPGNVRELGNVVQRAAVTSDGEWLSPSHLDLASAALSPPGHEPPGGEVSGSFRAARAATLAAFERRYVEELLRKHGGNVTRAAREAEQDRRAFGRFIKKYGIDRTSL
jgi:DNA-binding NtrC family response regulator